MDLGTRLAVIRRIRHLKQNDVARRVGMSAKHLSQIETGRANLLQLKSGLVAALARVLHVRADYLLGLTDDDRHWQPDTDDDAPVSPHGAGLDHDPGAGAHAA